MWPLVIKTPFPSFPNDFKKLKLHLIVLYNFFLPCRGKQLSLLRYRHIHPPTTALMELTCELAAIRRFLVPPLNMAFTSSHACTTSMGGSPSNRMCRRHELKLAASGCTYLLSARRCEWNTNLFGLKNMAQYRHLMHLARDELYLVGKKTILNKQLQL